MLLLAKILSSRFKAQNIELLNILSVQLQSTMRRTIFYIILSLLLSTTAAFSQSRFIYFQAAYAYITLPGEADLQGPVNNSDIIIINSDQGEITFLSTSAKVYKITKVETAENNAVYYYAKDRDGYEIILMYIKMGGTQENDTSIAYWNLDGSNRTILGGTVGKVF